MSYISKPYIQPRKTDNRNVILNSQNIDKHKRFKKFKKVSNCGYIEPCDPRLVNKVIGQITQINEPPLGYVDISDCHDRKWKYRKYKDIDHGDYYYYYNKKTEDPYFSPVFYNRYDVRTRIVKDPIGINRRYFDINYDNFSFKDASFKSNNMSFTNDTNIQREYFLSHKLTEMNQCRYFPNLE